VPILVVAVVDDDVGLVSDVVLVAPPALTSLSPTHAPLLLAEAGARALWLHVHNDSIPLTLQANACQNLGLGFKVKVS
jgi:hypothetical protein